MDSLLAMIALWLSFNFSLPAPAKPPNVEMLTKHEMLFRRYRAFTAQAQKEVLAAFAEAAASPDHREPVALYDDASNTIYLSQGWSGTNPAQLSVLVHEMVHHAQRHSDLRYECPAQRELLAYQAQDRWLNMFGKRLFEEFNLDEFTLKLTTSCAF